VIPRIIDRYILKEILVPAGIGTAVFVFVFMVSKLFRVTEMVVDQAVPLGYALKLFFCLIPALLVFVVPMAFLLGVLLALARLSADSEIIALKASGVGLYRLSPPVAFVAVVTCLLTSFLVLHAVPWGSATFRDTLIKLAETKAKLNIQERIFNDMFTHIVIYVDRVSNRGQSMEGVMIYDERDPEANHTIVARRGYLTRDIEAQKVVLNLFDGSIHSLEAGGDTYRTINFNTYQFAISLREELQQARKERGMRMLEKEMSVRDLRNRIKRLAREGRDIRPQMVELHFKFAIPFAALVFGLVGIPLGAQSTQSGRSWGFILSLFVLLLYYILYCLGKNLASVGLVPPALAAWSPNVLFGALGIYLFFKAAQESPLRILLWGERGLQFLKRRWKRWTDDV